MNYNFKPKKFVFMSERQRLSPFPNYMSMEAVCREMKNYVGITADIILMFFQDGNIARYFQDKSSNSRTSRYVFNKIKRDLKFPAKMILKQKKFGRDLVDFSKQAATQVSAKTSNLQLYKIYAEFEKRYKPVYATYGWIWMVDQELTSNLVAIIEKKINPRRQKVAEIFNILTQQLKAMVATLERRAFLELSLRVAKNKNWQTLVKNKQISRAPELEKLIKRHVRNYFWVTRDYEDAAITVDVVISRLAEWFKKDIAQEYEELIKQINQNEVLRKKYLVSLGFT